MAGLQSSPISNQNQYSSNSSQSALDRMSTLSAELNSVPNKTNGEILMEKLQEAGVTISSQDDLNRLNNTLDNQFGAKSSNTIYASDEPSYNFSFKTPTPTFGLPSTDQTDPFRRNYNSSLNLDTPFTPAKSKTINLDTTEQFNARTERRSQEPQRELKSTQDTPNSSFSLRLPTSPFDLPPANQTDPLSRTYNSSLNLDTPFTPSGSKTINLDITDQFKAMVEQGSKDYRDQEATRRAELEEENETAKKGRTTGGGGDNRREGWTLDENGKWITIEEAAANRKRAREQQKAEDLYIDGIAQNDIDYDGQRQAAWRAEAERQALARQQEQTRQENYRQNPLLLNQTLANLIDSGADAQANLFEVTIFAGQNAEEFSSLEAQAIQKNLTFRINNFNAPAKQLPTQDLPYQTAVYKKIVPGSSLTRQLDFNIRLDYNYKIYWYLHRIFAGDSFGNFDLNLLKKNFENYVCTIQVKALSPKPVKLGYIPSAMEEEAFRTSYLTSPAQFDISYSWTFFDCYLIQIPQIGFGYEQSGALIPTFSFIFGMMAEGIGETGLMSSPLKDDAFSLLNRDDKLESEEE